MRSKKDEYSIYAHEALKKFKQQYHCSEDYFPQVEFPFFTMNELVRAFNLKNPLLFKAIFLQIQTGILWYQLVSTYFQAYKKPIHRLACDNVVLQLVQHGECGILSGGMILQFLQDGQFPRITRWTMDRDLHSFIVIGDEEEQIQIAIDPFFNICCPLDEYWSKEQVIAYGQTLKSKSWMPKTSSLKQHVYTTSEELVHLPLVKQQIENTLQLATNSSFQERISFIRYAISLGTVFDTDVLFSYVKKIYEEDAQNDYQKIITKGFLKHIYDQIKSTPANMSLFPDVHKIVLNEFTDIMKASRTYSSLLQLIREKKYGSALRTAANNEHGYEFVACLLKYKVQLNLDINEQPGEKKLSALHYAAQFPDGKTYKLLLEHGANPKSPCTERGNETAEERFHQNQSLSSCQL